MPLQSSHVFASHIGHTGKTTLSFQMSSYYAIKHPETSVLVMDLSEEGDLTKRLLGGSDAASEKIDALFGGVFQLLSDADRKGSRISGWLWSEKFDVEKYAIQISEHNSGIPKNMYLISSGAWPRSEPPMEDKARKQVCEKIKASLQESKKTWKLFCDTDGDRRPSPFTMLGYGLCGQAIVPLHLNKCDLDRTETMLGVMHHLRTSGEIQTQVLFVVWNFVKSRADTECEWNGMTLPFTPTKVCLDILDACNKRLHKISQELEGLFVHGGPGISEADFVHASTTVLRQLADNVMKPSEELGLPFAEMLSKLGTKSALKFKTGGVEYQAQRDVVEGVDASLNNLATKFEAMVL